MKELVRWILLYLGLPWITTGWMVGLFYTTQYEKFIFREIAFWTYLSHYILLAICAVIVWAFS